MLLGSQRPRFCHVPEYSATTGDEAIELAALAGLYLDDWQQFVLRHMLGEKADGKWSALTVGLCVPRQNGKGSILEARELVGLFLLNEQLIIHTAHLQKTATSHFKRLRNLIRAVPEFSARVAKMPEGKGSEAIELVTGQTIYFATRSGGGGRGLTADLLVFDEAMYLTEMDRSALVPSMAARSMEGNIQTIYAGSAVDQETQDGVPFAKVREAGLTKNASTAYFEWSLPYEHPDDVPLDVAADPESHRLTNPGYNKRISPEWIEHERMVEMSARGFRIERTGVGDWPDTSEDANRVIPRAAWAKCAEHDSSIQIVSSPFFAIDCDPDGKWASIVIGGKRADGLVQVALVERHQELGWLVPAVQNLRAHYPQARFVIDKNGPTSDLIGNLEAVKIKDKRVVQGDAYFYRNACIGFVAAANAEEPYLRYLAPQPEMDEALTGAIKLSTGDSWKWSRLKSTTDISPIVAATLAFWAASTLTKVRAGAIDPNAFLAKRAKERADRENEN